MSELLTRERVRREVLVTPETQRKPVIVARLRDWEYLETSLMRLMCAWGRYFPAWADKVACHRHIWEQSECAQLLRDRLRQFPGTTSNLDTPVSPQLEHLVNTVLQAPSHQDAIDGIYTLLMGALTTAYLDYGGRAHPVHDAPTLATLRQVLGFKNGMRLWLADFRRAHPHTTDDAYKRAVEAALEECGGLHQAIAVEDEEAAPCGVRTNFQLPALLVRPPDTAPRHNLMPLLEADFSTSLEARRLFWAYGYLLEMTLAEGMLQWLWAAHFMPWDYQKALARHLWDESRHGDSGFSRLLDFGITLEEIGYGYHGAPMRESDEAVKFVPNMTPAELYESAFFVGMVAETGHFTVKNEAYQDFKAGGDLESAEMMLFDVIDEGAHVQYCHEWLPELAKRAGLSNDGYRERATQIRSEKQLNVHKKVADAQSVPRDETTEDYRFYQQLLARMRAVTPLSNAHSCPPRSLKPM